MRFALSWVVLCLAGCVHTQSVLVEPEIVSQSPAENIVVLLHGLARSPNSMSRMEAALKKAGYTTCNVGYPSTRHPIETLASHYVLPKIQACINGSRAPINFVTHSLGGIVMRQLAQLAPDLRVGRVVMLSPPNHGSEIVDKLGALTLFRLITGPAGLQLGADEESVSRSLDPASFEVGIITGRRPINPILSLLIPGANDGKVSVESAKLEGMTDFCIATSSHTYIMNNEYVIEQTLTFLAKGEFTCDTQSVVTTDRLKTDSD